MAKKTTTRFIYKILEDILLLLYNTSLTYRHSKERTMSQNGGKKYRESIRPYPGQRSFVDCSRGLTRFCLSYSIHSPPVSCSKP